MDIRDDPPSALRIKRTEFGNANPFIAGHVLAEELLSGEGELLFRRESDYQLWDVVRQGPLEARPEPSTTSAPITSARFELPVATNWPAVVRAYMKPEQAAWTSNPYLLATGVPGQRSP